MLRLGRGSSSGSRCISQHCDDAMIGKDLLFQIRGVKVSKLGGMYMFLLHVAELWINPKFEY